MIMCAHTMCMGMFVSRHVWKLEGKSVGSVLSFYFHVGSNSGSQAGTANTFTG